MTKKWHKWNESDIDDWWLTYDTQVIQMTNPAAQIACKRHARDINDMEVTDDTTDNMQVT